MTAQPKTKDKDYTGYHQFGAGLERHGSFEVWQPAGHLSQGRTRGWRWRDMAKPDKHHGPFATSNQAYCDARYGDGK